MKISDLIDIDKLEYKWDVIDTIPEFAVLKTCEQNPKWHSCGNVWNHLKLVCQAALDYVKNEFQNYDLANNDIKILLAAALFHDIGKGVTTEFKKGNWHAYGHEIKGENITRRLLWDENIFDREAICSLVRWHMEPLRIFESKHYVEKIISLSRNVKSLKLLYALKTFDIKGSYPEDARQTKYDLNIIGRLITLTRNLSCYYGGVNTMVDIPTKDNFDKKIVIHMMMGISGAGKSTHVEKIIENHKKQYPDIDIVVVSRDIARVALKYCGMNEKYVGTPEEENMVTAYCHELIRESAKAGKHIIIDDMNLKRKYRDGFKNILKEYYCSYEYHYVECGSFDVNVKRREGQVPKDVLHNMINSIEWPTGDEYDIMYISQN